MPLLWVCDNFRKVVYAKYCREHNIDLGREQESRVPSWPLWPRCLNDIGRFAPNLVRTLSFYVSIRSIYSGEALSILSSAPYDGCAFPKARTTRCAFYLSLVDLDDAEHATDIEGNIRLFMDRVKQTIPLPKDVTVYPGHIAANMPRDVSGHHYTSLISLLCQLSHKVYYRALVPTLSLEMHADGVRNLVHFWYQSMDEGIDHSWALGVARWNAPTLQLLNIAAALPTGISALIRGLDGDCVRYSFLESLELDMFGGPPVPFPPVAHGVVLFPKLVNLTIFNHYPFSDDLPFRGNAATLGKLSIPVSRELRDILRRYSVFTPTSHADLECVEIDMPLDSIPDIFESSEACMQFALSIGQHASNMYIRGISLGEDLSSALGLTKDHTCIRELALPDTPLMLWDVELLTRSLPLLSDLHCMTAGLGLLIDDIGLDNYAAHMCSLSNPARKRFRCWRFGFAEMAANFLGPVQCVLSVALMCPNFTHVAVCNRVRGRFMLLMEQTIESDGFKQHAPRLRQLLK
ncbi:hypothetical protein GGI21_002134 [Coemansia aciculifera]|nr:hypothetical protein GGI21_002134 [Coemansia aciculifera]